MGFADSAVYLFLAEMGYITDIEAMAIDRKKAAAFFKSELYSRIKNAGEKVWREKKFMVALAQLDLNEELLSSFRNSDGMIKGIADLLFEEDGEIIIVDYKSDRGISEKHLCEKYKMQLMLYKAAIELTCKKKVKQTYLYSFELCKAVEIEIEQV